MYEFPVTGPVNADIRASDGRVESTAEEGRTTATVTVEPLDNSEQSRDAAARTTVEMRGSTLAVKMPDISGSWLRRRGACVAITLFVPAASTIEFRSSAAHGTFHGSYGRFEAHTACGDVFVETVTGDFSANAASGDISAGHVRGDLKVNSASGDLNADQVDGTVVAHSASGDIELATVGTGAKLNTASGDVKVGVLRRGNGKVNSASGDVTIGVAAGTSVWMDITSMSGRARSELDTSSAPVNGGDPDVTLHLRSMSGDITVKRG